MKKILITGGLGFIGCNLADFFLQHGDEVIILDNFLRKGSEKNLSYLVDKYKKLEMESGDVRHINDISKVLEEKNIDVILHTAGQTAVTTSVINPQKDFEINALGTFNVLEAARLSKNDPIIIFTSTNKVYGDNVNKIPLIEKKSRYEFSDEKFKHGIPEDFPTDAEEHTPYGSSKYSGDIYTRDYSRIYGLKTVVFRMSCIYGFRQNGNEDQGWLAHFLISAMNNKPITIFGDGKQVRDVLFISDFVELFDICLKKINKTRGQVYNIGGGHENTISLLELLDLMKKWGLSPKHSFSDWRPADQKVYVSDIRKVEKETGWKPKTNPDTGVRKLLEWAKETI
ncbi:MAG: GDP-mannose 4,6-dehydratase [Candidatus Aenigmarchaeota archaeon]|nr:GDP-mannose 4,6-dehydratase [Candidatus Aenigmarchaeota archaeon]